MREILTAPQKAEESPFPQAWFSTQTNYPRNKTIQALFEEQAALFPNKIAVSDGADSMTYQELNQQANRLAHYLHRLGLKQEAPVAFYTQRSVTAIVAMLGILKAGGAYLPIDVDSPLERIELMLEDSQATLLLTQHDLLPIALDVLAKDMQRMVVSLDNNKKIQQESSHNLNNTAEQNSLAYIVYTSGSTGQPKGVEITHRGVVSLIRGASYVMVQSDFRFAQTSNIAFDAATFEIWGALLNAATLFIVPKDTLLCPESLSQYVVMHHISVLWLTSGLFNKLFLAKPELFKGLNYLLIGGENLNRNIIERLLNSSNKPQHIINGYGPTENTTFSLCYEINTLPDSQGVPLGKSIANKTCYVLDKFMQPVKEGGVGELFVGGDGLARGYLNKETLSKKSFIKNPFVADDADFNQRLYRTGDFVRHLPGGDLELVGRYDNQVKIRGFRVELEGVEAIIAQHSAVEQAAVLLHEAKGNGSRLIAFVILKADDNHTNDLKDLRDFLKKKIPDYMIPVFFEIVDEFPLDQNGKVNRRHLVKDYEAPTQELKSIEVPHTELEATLLAIWQGMFDVKTIGVKDNFFALGGDSLRAMDVVAKSHKERLDISVTQVFEHPTVAELAKVATLRKHTKTTQNIVPRQENDTLAYPLTSLQQGILLHSMGSKQYTQKYLVQTSFNIFVALDVEAFKKAWGVMLERHDILRVSFQWRQGDQPIQQVAEKATTPWSYHDWATYKAKDRASKLKRLTKKDFDKGFDLSTPPLLRICLIRMKEEKFHLIFTQHHLVVDGRSLEVFLRELFDIYHCIKQNAVPKLPSSTGYFEFVAWLSRQRLDKARKYWRELLCDFNTVTPLSFTECWQKNPDPEKAVYARQIKFLSTHKSNALRAYLKVTRLTLSTLAQAAWGLLLSHYSGERDVVFGMVVNLHPIGVDVDHLLGPTINVVPVRVKLSDDLDTLSYLRKIKKTTGEVLHYAYCPLLEIKKCSGIEKTESLFNTILAVENYLSYPNLGVPTDRVVVKDENHYPLAVQIFPDKELGVEIIYDKNLFSQDFIRRLRRHFVNFLLAFLNHPYQEVLSLALLSQVEKQQVLLDWNSTNIDFSAGNATITDLFEKQALETPNNIAINFDGHQMTYEELNKKVNKTANYFKSLKIQPSSLVAIFLEREPNMIISILSTLKLGAAYLPIDPLYPVERIDQILQDANPSLVVTSTGLPDYLGDIGRQFNFAFLDKTKKIIDEQSEENLEHVVLPSDLAYVIYTSGSTGKPKGVMIDHAAIMNFLNGMQKLFKIDESDRLINITTLAFDISALEIYLPLLHGAQLFLLPSKFQFDPTQFSRFLQKNGISLLQATPGIYQALLNIGWRPKPHCKLLCGGEALPYKLMRKLMRYSDLVWNMYGPTETTVWSTCYKIKPGQAKTPYALIGKPIANTKVYVLDAQHRLLPVGVVGELYIGGEGLAQGYLNQEAMTDQNFVHVAEYGRVYKTGDLVRWLSEGNLEYVGRVDYQIKFRGHRGELSEIEDSIVQYSGVEMAVVLKTEVDAKDYLFAYIKLESSRQLFNLAKLREFLGETLPYCFIPTKFFVVDEFPYTPNAKINRKALAKQTNTIQALNGAYEVPTNKYEQKICELFSKVLKVPVAQIGRFANFFELGGDSFSAMRFINLVEGELCISLAIADFFRHPIPYAQAALIMPRANTDEEN